MSSISIQHISYQYDSLLGNEKTSSTREWALEDISLEIPDGQFLCLIGYSGSGKSTLLRLLLGLASPTQGNIFIDGKPVDGPGLDRSFVFQNYSLFPWMKVKANVEFGIAQANKELKRNLSKEDVSRIAMEYLEQVDMKPAAQAYPYQLSGGMKQRVAIARALAMDTEILLFDEPFGALDMKTRCSLQKLIDNLWRNGEKKKTVIFVTHDISEAALLADRIVFMDKGRIQADFSVSLPRPRSSKMLLEHPEAVSLVKQLEQCFYADSDSDTYDFLEADDSRIENTLIENKGFIV